MVAGLRSSEAKRGRVAAARLETPPDLLESALLLTKETLRSERASFMSLTEDNRLRIDWAYGLPIDIPQGSKVPISGVAGWVIQNRQPLLVRDIKKNARRRTIPARGEGYRTPSFLSIPVLRGDRVLGVMNAADREDGKPFNHRDLTVAQLLAEHISLVLEVRRLAGEVQRLALEDPLTGAWNRRAFEIRLSEEMARTQRSRNPLTLLLLDLDQLKRFNDAYGHLVGDALLRHLHHLLKSEVRAADHVFRFGGDEFVIILPGTGLYPGMFVADRLAEAVILNPLTGTEGESYPISISLGAAAYQGEKASPDELLNHADRALYATKASRLSAVHGWGEGNGRKATYLPWLRKLQAPTKGAAKVLPPQRAKKWKCLPVWREGKVLTVAFAHLPSNRLLQEMENTLQHKIQVALAPAEALREAWKAFTRGQKSARKIDKTSVKLGSSRRI